MEGKHIPFLPEDHRAELIDALRDIDFTHLNRGRSTADVLRQLRPRYYVKGADWRDRLPEAETTLCRELGIEIAYADHTGDASRDLLKEYHQRRHGVLAQQVQAFEAAVLASPPAAEATHGASACLSTFITDLTALLSPPSVIWYGEEEEQAGELLAQAGVPPTRGPAAFAELVVLWWPTAPPPLANLLPKLLSQVECSRRWLCVVAPFITKADQLLAVSDDVPTAELVRALLTLNGFRSFTDLEPLLAVPPGCTPLLLEWA